MTKGKLPRFIYFKAKTRDGKECFVPYQGKFKHKGVQYNCGNHATIREAQIAVDTKRLYLGLEPEILKKKP